MSTLLALVVTSTANSPKIADRASLQVTTVLVAEGVIDFSCGINSVPTHAEALPTSRATSRRHAVLSDRERRSYHKCKNCWKSAQGQGEKEE